MCCTSTQCDAQETCSATRCRSLLVGCHFVSCVHEVFVISVPVCSRIDVLSRKILASMQLAFRDLGLPLVRKLSIWCRLPRQRHLLCLGLLQQSRSVLVQPLEHKTPTVHRPTSSLLKTDVSTVVRLGSCSLDQPRLLSTTQLLHDLCQQPATAWRR